MRLLDGIKNMFLDIAAAVHGFFYGFIVISATSVVIGLIVYFGIAAYKLVFS